MFYYNGKHYTEADITKVLGVPVRGKGGFESTKVIVEEKIPEMPRMPEYPVEIIPSKSAHGGQQKQTVKST